MFKRRSWILVFVAALAAVFAAGCGASNRVDNGGATVSVDIETKEFEFKPNTITAKPEQLVLVTMKNTGSVEHTFVIKEASFALRAMPGKTVTGTFKAPSKLGSYEIDCDVPGHDPAGMRGILKVEQAPE